MNLRKFSVSKTETSKPSWYRLCNWARSESNPRPYLSHSHWKSDVLEDEYLVKYYICFVGIKSEYVLSGPTSETPHYVSWVSLTLCPKIYWEKINPWKHSDPMPSWYWRDLSPRVPTHLGKPWKPGEWSNKFTGLEKIQKFLEQYWRTFKSYKIRIECFYWRDKLLWSILLSSDH